MMGLHAELVSAEQMAEVISACRETKQVGEGDLVSRWFETSEGAQIILVEGQMGTGLKFTCH